RPVYRPFVEFLNLPFQGVEDVTVARCKLFNEEVPNSPKVRYYSVAGKHDRAGFDWQWELPGRILDEVEGPNDGIVSLRSAHWGENCDVWDGDHMSLVNWRPPGSRAAP